MDNKLFSSSLRNSFLAVIYIFAVSQVMARGDQWFGNLDNSFLAPFAFLLLFCASAAVVGGLIFGQSVFLFFDGKKKESVQAALYSVAGLVAMAIIVLALLILVGRIA